MSTSCVTDVCFLFLMSVSCVKIRCYGYNAESHTFSLRLWTISYPIFCAYIICFRSLYKESLQNWQLVDMVE